MDFPEALFCPLLHFSLWQRTKWFLSGDWVDGERLGDLWKGVKRLVRVFGFWVTYKVLFKVVLTQMYSHIHYFRHTLLFHFPDSFANSSQLSVTAKPSLNLPKLEQMFNKCLNSVYEREIHHLFKRRDMKNTSYSPCAKSPAWRVTSKCCVLDAAVNQLQPFFIYTSGRCFYNKKWLIVHSRCTFYQYMLVHALLFIKGLG